MHSVFGLLAHHTYLLLFGWVLIEQGGLPIPSVPVMLAAGTMSAAHHLHIAYALPLVMLACLISDSMWYFLGKRYGGKVLDILCRFSLEAATCVSRTEGTVVKRGATTLLFAKFVPGLSTMAAPDRGAGQDSVLAVCDLRHGRDGDLGRCVAVSREGSLAIWPSAAVISLECWGTSALGWWC